MEIRLAHVPEKAGLYPFVEQAEEITRLGVIIIAFAVVITRTVPIHWERRFQVAFLLRWQARIGCKEQLIIVQPSTRNKQRRSSFGKD